MRRILLGCLLLLAIGCGTQHSGTIQISDPLVESNRQWQALVDKANFALKQERADAALDFYNQSLELKPESSDVHLKIAQIHLKNGDYESAVESFQTSLRIAPDQVDAWNYLGYVNEKLQRYDEAVSAFHSTLERAPANLYALNHMGLAYRQLGKLDEAEAVLRTALDIDPKCERSENDNTHNYLGLVYEDKGDVADAIAEYRESIRIFPEEIWARNRLGVLYENQGRYYEAQLVHAETLEIDAENALAKQRLQAMQEASGQVAVDVSPVEIVADDTQAIIAAAPDASEYPDADAVVLLSKFSHEVLSDNRSRYTTHRIIKVLTERGKQHADIAVPFNARSQNIGVNFARTILPDGTELEPPNEAYSDVTPPGLLSYNLYSDMMWKVVTMPAVVPGAIIEYQVTLEDAAGSTAGQEVWFWGGMQFQGTEPVLQSVCAVRIPTEHALAWRVYQTDTEPEIQATDEHRIYTWRAGAYPSMPVEPSIADAASQLPRLSYSSVQTWERVSQWYRDLAKERYEADDAIRAFTQELTQGLDDHEAKLRSIYNFVAGDIRYVGIEYGQGAYQPSPAPEVLRYRYGDCKDKATLLITMYDLIGQKAYPALLQPSPYEPVDTSLPSPTQFSHLIVAMPTPDGDYLWLDPTAAYCRFGELPHADQGRTALVVNEEDGVLEQTKQYGSDSNRLELSSHLKLTEDGMLSGREHTIAYGEYNQLYRLTYHSMNPSQWKNSVAIEMATRYPGVQVEDVQVSHLDNLNHPIEVAVIFQAPIPTNGPIVLPLSLTELGDYASFVALPERQYPLDLGYPARFEQTTVLELPTGWAMQSQQKSGKWESNIGVYEREVVRDVNHVRWQSTFEIQDTVIAPDAYQPAKRFLERAVQESRLPLVLVRPAS